MKTLPAAEWRRATRLRNDRNGSCVSDFLSDLVSHQQSIASRSTAGRSSCRRQLWRLVHLRLYLEGLLFDGTTA